MPVKIPDGLPAAKILEHEWILVMPESRAFAQDIRPLRVAIVNVMPLKSVTETQLLRLLSNSPLQVAVTFIHPTSHKSRNTSPEHLERFYRSFTDVREQRFDCLIITGAPVETLAFEDVAYWSELQEIMAWSKTHVHSTLHICWGAQAGLYHHFGVQKRELSAKASGIFSHSITSTYSPLLQGFDEEFWAPHSRHTAVDRQSIERVPTLRILSESSEVGIYLVATHDYRQIFVTGHPEYDPETLALEYERDLAKGLAPAIPANYYLGDDTRSLPQVRWRSHAHLLFSNWLNVVYQSAPYDLAMLGV